MRPVAEVEKTKGGKARWLITSLKQDLQAVGA
jgi:hypothetical protein